MYGHLFSDGSIVMNEYPWLSTVFIESELLIFVNRIYHNKNETSLSGSWEYVNLKRAGIFIIFQGMIYDLFLLIGLC